MEKYNCLKNIFFLFVLLANSANLSAQYNPVSLAPQVPKPPNPYSAFSPYSNIVKMEQQTNRNIAPQNQPNRNNYLEQYERDRMETERRNAELLRIMNENRDISYDLPSLSNIEGTEYYRQAAEKLTNMLRGKTQLNLRDAVFAVENAYFEGILDKTRYNKSIDDLIYLAKQQAANDKYNWNNNLTKNIMLFKIMADTLKIKLPLQEKTITSYPMQYDFDDPHGRIDFSKQFVYKLLSTRSGQCHSLPLLYLIMCETVGAEAYLAYSPLHSYVKIKDKTGNWYNIELTNGRFTTDAFVTGSGFVTAEAIKNRIYLEPQTKKQTIANCFVDLLGGYTRKYGYDEFVNRCVDTILKYDTKNLRALMSRSNYQTFRLGYIMSQIGQPSLETLKQRYPKVYELLEECKKIYEKIDELGYREMPEEAYKEWLETMNREKKRIEEHEAKYGKILQLLN
ncbi:MAG: hypothetical protein LBP85_04325 [Prevotellaceae bacterium]|jgi:hypothetical protein|nr:hypothetical protein [Prevotellaceae bacterium]